MSTEVVSFDVFDTIVTRAFAHPRDVFVYLGEQLQARGLVALDGLSFAEERWAAEHAARRACAWNEVLLDDIYRELARRLEWSEATRDQARDIELEIESRHLHAVPFMRALLAGERARAGRLAFLSDMYLPAAILRKWLEREEVCTSQDLLLVSGETRGSKSSGILFEAARQATGGDFKHWHHTGDHPFADVEKPRRLGAQATHFIAAHRTPREEMARASAGEFAPVWRSLLSGAMRLARLERLQPSARKALLWEIGTNVAGPLFFGFVAWTLREARRRGLRRLYFIARDGQLFWRIARELESTAGADAITCHYLYASRLVFAGPSELTDAAALRELAVPDAPFHSLRQAILALGLEPEVMLRELPPEFATRDPDANLPFAERDAVAAWLLASPHLEKARTSVATRARRARDYLTSVGLCAGEPVGLVDTGWLGSIQRNLEYIVGRDAPAPLTGFYLGLVPPVPPATLGERIGYTNAFAPLPLLFSDSHKVIIELLAQSDHGQVVGFESAERGFAPILRDPGPVNLSEIRLMQDAVLAFTRRLISATQTAPMPEGPFDRAVIGLYRDLHDDPTPDEVRLFGFMPHADQLFEQRHATLCTEFSLVQTLAALANHERRPPHWWLEGQAVLGHGIWIKLFRALKRLRWKLAGRHE